MAEFRVKFLEIGTAYLFTDPSGTRYCVVAPDIEKAVRGYKNRHGEQTKIEPKNIEYVGYVIVTEGCDVTLPDEKKE